MSYYMICPNCGKGTIGRYATDNNLCGECSDNSSTTEKLSVDKLQEQLNTTKKALKEISEVKNLTPFKKGFETSKAVSKARDMRNTARQTLAAIGWGGCPVGAVGKNGLTKEEIEGSGDE